MLVPRRQLLLLFLLTACQARTASGPELLPGPAPTEHRQDPDAEGRNRERRREWLEAMHRAAPGVDWREIERQNGLAAMERRRGLRGAPSSPNAGTWRELGSRNQAGRMFDTVISSDGQSLYSGAALGGLWKSDRAGGSWQPLSDHLYGGVERLAAVPGGGGQPDVLLRLSAGMIHRSADQGTSWTAPAGFGSRDRARVILAVRDAADTVLVITQDSTYFNGWKLWRSTDRGQSFYKVRDMGQWGGDLWTPRDRLGPIYLIERKELYQSLDGGASFTQLGNPLPYSSKELKLRGQEQPGGIFNVALKNGAIWELWRSEDYGQSWIHRHDFGDFWGAFDASITDPGVLAYGGVEMHVSRDGGQSFAKVNNWWDYYGNPSIYLHADIMDISVLQDPLGGGEIWYVGTDGGVYESRDVARTVRNLSLSGLGVSQYYDVHTSARNPNYLLAGSQDQGYQRADLGTPAGGGGPWADFDQLISGDYGHLSSGDGSHDYVYCTYPGFILIQVGEGSPALYTEDFPAGTGSLWLPPVVADPLDKQHFYFLGTELYRYEKRTGVNDWTYAQHGGYAFNGTLSALAFSPLDPDRAWACTTDGRIFHSGDHGLNWTQSLDTGPGSHYFYGTAIVPSSLNADEVWIGGSGYSTAPVKRSRDGGVTWQEERDGLPDTLIYCLAEAPDGSGVMVAGSESGAWRWDPATGQWSDILGLDAPITLYWCVEAVPSSYTLRFGTYGRGIWDFELKVPGFYAYGQGLGGANVMTLSSPDVPIIGGTVRLDVGAAPAYASGFLALSPAADSAPYFGGTRLISLTGVQALPIDTGLLGLVRVRVQIPNNPALVGGEYYLQAALQDPQQPGGWALSHGLRALIGG